MKYFLILLLSTSCLADVVSLRDANMTFDSYFKGAYHPIVNNAGIKDNYLDKGLSLNLNTDIFNVFYWNNSVRTLIDKTDGTGQYRTVGWQYEFGLRFTDFLSVYYHHHSQHLIDYKPPVRYYIEDSIGIKINFFSSDTKPGVLW